MQKFEIDADKLFAVSKPAFFRLVPCCDVNFVHGYSQMFLNIHKVAQEQPKGKRIETIALVLSYCNQEHIEKFKQWLIDYCSMKMQNDLFDLTVSVGGEFICGKMLERAINKLRKR